MNDPRLRGRRREPVAVRGIGTAVPEHVVPQAEARTFARQFFQGDLLDIDALVGLFDNTGIERRYAVRPLAWYGEHHTFAQRNAVYAEQALALTERAAREALARSGVAPGAVGTVLFASSTGLSTPSLDSHLIQRLDLPRSAARVPLWGLGCAAGGAGLARAAELARATAKPVLLVAVELCTLTFLRNDRSKSNLVATALFGDGAAAAVVALGNGGPEILAGHSHLVDDSTDVMAWALEDAGLRVVFGRHIPDLVQNLLPAAAHHAAVAAGLDGEPFAHYAFHPGSSRVLDVCAQSLGLNGDLLASSRSVLREYGNMSSPTVLFVLERLLRDVPRREAPGLLMAFGPGFSTEGLVFRW